jgi:hypothetical protein
MEGAWQGRAHHIVSFCLRRGALELSAHHHLEGGTLERREQDKGKAKARQGFKGTSKGKVKARGKERGPKVS